ncbi:hypothetical protein FGADI_10463 [Fusarium gaditjirri]|uniref:Uncharacterized protein n=1 Tax=Fusarium gaditjirri TaxID=282569 RepID=A0A8H4SX57_9HYPO|nr:hypothetical protein FGADI_10463 [Fusarium gaditjirri]
MAVDRERYRPIIKIRATKAPQGLPNALDELALQGVFEFSLSTGITEELLADITQSFRLNKDSRDSLGEIIRRLFSIFQEKEALSLETDLLFLKDGKFMCNNSDFFFDDAAVPAAKALFAEVHHRSSKRARSLKSPHGSRITRNKIGDWTATYVTLDIHVEAGFGKAAQEAVRLAATGAKAEKLKIKRHSIRELSDELEEDSKAA